jgi:hypothetical protein
MPDEPAAPATGTEPPAAPAPPAEPEPAQPEPATGDPAAPQPSAKDAGASDDAAKWKALARKHEDQNKATRGELDKLRADRESDQAAAAERNRKLAIALGVAPDDTPLDPAKLAEELERTKAANTAAADSLKAEIRQRDLRLAVLTQAPSLEANGLLLMDSLSFLRKLDGLDPAADDFTERVGEAIKAAAEGNAQYRLARPADPPKPPPAIPRSGGEFNGAPGGNRQWNIEDVQRASAAEVAKAQEDGLLIDLGFNPRKTRR